MQGSNPGLPHCRQILYHRLSHQWTIRLLPCLGFVNSAAMNTGVHVSFELEFFFVGSILLYNLPLYVF